MTWPRKIFLESTALFQLGARLENVELAELLQLRDGLKFELMVAEVSWREYLRRREKEIRDCLAKTRQCKADLAKHGQPLGDLERAEQNVLKYLEVLPDNFSQKARNLGITVLPTPGIEVQKLLGMSLGCVPPFEDSQSDAGEKTKEKGFRDALIMFTILGNIQNRPGDNALVVTHDNRLSQGFQRHASEYQTSLEIVPKLEAAVSHVYGKVERWYRDKLQREAGEAKSVLLKYREQISENVRHVRELTENDLGQGILSRILGGTKPEEHLNIQELRSLTFDDVESALWKDKDKATSRILFKIRCLAHVIGTPPTSFVSWSPTTFTVGGGKQSRIAVSASEGPAEVEKDLPVKLYGEAKLERGEGGWRLVDLKVDKSLPDEEWKELQKIAIRLGQ